MRRNEACSILTKIASDELIDKFFSREILKARDIVVCEPHKVLDVLATDEQRQTMKMQLLEDIRFMIDNSMIDASIRKPLYDLRVALSNHFQDGCEKAYLKDRCQNCPNFKGNKND